MAVIDVCERPESPEGNIGETISFRRIFLVDTSTVFDGAIVVLTAAGIPNLGDGYTFGGSESNADVKAQSKEARRLEPNARQWEVVVIYANDEFDGELINPIVKVGFETRQKPLLKAFKANEAGAFDEVAMVNSCGDQFDPLPVGQEYILTLSISRNENEFTQVIANARKFIGHPATDKVMGIDGAIMRGIGIEKKFSLTKTGLINRFFEVSYNLWFPPDIEVLDIGPFFCVQESGTDPITRNQFVTAEGHPRLGLLDGKGNKLDDDKEPIFLGPFKPAKPIPFRSLGLPTSFDSVIAIYDFTQ